VADPSSQYPADPHSAQPELDFDGRYRVEHRPDGDWHLTGPMFRAGGKTGMRIPGGSPELVEKYRNLAELLNAAVDAERRR
jgi:hypothetical protein